MTKPQAIRKRAFAPKVRTGCTTCKARKIKCDETKPRCQACTSCNASCSYNLPTRAASFRAIRPKSVEQSHTFDEYGRSRAPPLLLTAGPASAFAHLGSRDIMYLEYFVRKLQHQFSLPRLGDESLADFWFRTVLQQGQREGYILEALVSIGALAWARKSTPTRVPLIQYRLSGALRNEHYRKALHHYSRAIDQTRRVLAESPAGAHMQVILMSSILFWMVETIQDNSSAVDRIGAAAIEYLPKQVTRGQSVLVKPTTEFAQFILSNNGNNVIYSTFSPAYPSSRERLLEMDSSMVLEPPAALGPERNLHEFVSVWWRLITTMLNFGVHSDAAGGGCIVSRLPAAQVAWLLSVIVSWEREARERATVATSSPAARLLRTMAKFTSRLGRAVQAQGASCQTLERLGGHVVAYSDFLDYAALLDVFRTSQTLKPASASGGPPLEDGFDLINEAAYDAALPALFYIARRCPLYATRCEALRLCRPLLRPVASLSLKTTYMVLQALADAEGEMLANRYACTRSLWNRHYTALHVTLSPVPRSGGDTLETVDIELDAGDYDM